LARRQRTPKPAKPMLAGSGATEAATTAVPIGVPAGRGTPKTVLICEASTGFKLNSVAPPEDEISKRGTLPALVLPAVTVPNSVLLVRTILKLVSDAAVAFRVRVNPPECVMFVVVSPPVIGNIADTGEVLSVAGLTGVMLKPAPVRTDRVDVLNVTVVVPPVIAAACIEMGIYSTAHILSTRTELRYTLTAFMVLLLGRKFLTE
jgi:hypothetical protein